MATEINGGYYKVCCQYVYHAYVKSPPDTEFDCFLGITGPDNHQKAVTGEGNITFAKIICCMDPEDVNRKVYGKIFSPTMFKDSSGIEYGLTGICHQMANRILYSAGVMNFPNWWTVPYILFGFYGDAFYIHDSPVTRKAESGKKKYNWQEYLSAASLLFEGKEITDQAIEAGVPAVKEKVLGMRELYPDQAPLITMEVEQIDSKDLPLKRLEFFLEQSLKDSELNEKKVEFRSHILELIDDIQRLRGDVERDPDIYMNTLGTVNDLVGAKVAVFRSLLSQEQFKQSFDTDSVSSPPSIALGHIKTMQGSEKKINALYREHFEANP